MRHNFSPPPQPSPTRGEGEPFPPPQPSPTRGEGALLLPPPQGGREPCCSLPPKGGGSLVAPSPPRGEGALLLPPPQGGREPCCSLPPCGGGLGWGGRGKNVQSPRAQYKTGPSP